MFGNFSQWIGHWLKLELPELCIGGGSKATIKLKVDEVVIIGGAANCKDSRNISKFFAYFLVFNQEQACPILDAIVAHWIASATFRAVL